MASFTMQFLQKLGGFKPLYGLWQSSQFPFFSLLSHLHAFLSQVVALKQWPQHLENICGDLLHFIEKFN